MIFMPPSSSHSRMKNGRTPKVRHRDSSRAQHSIGIHLEHSLALAPSEGLIIVQQVKW